MKAFKDNESREWLVKVNIACIRRVKDLTNFNLLEIAEDEVIKRLIGDPVLLCNVIYAACKSQADERNISDEEFGEAMAGDAIDDATKALLEELADFFPNPKTRENLKKVIKATWTAIDRVGDLVATKLKDGVLEKRINKALETASASFGTALESLELTPTP